MGFIGVRSSVHSLPCRSGFVPGIFFGGSVHVVYTKSSYTLFIPFPISYYIYGRYIYYIYDLGVVGHLDDIQLPLRSPSWFTRCSCPNAKAGLAI